MSDTLTKTEEPVAIGDIFEDNWGYNQTNIDYYEVVGISKTGRVKLHRILNTYPEGRSAPNVPVSPVPGAFSTRHEPTGYKVVSESDMDGNLWVNTGYNSAACRVATASFIATKPEGTLYSEWVFRAKATETGIGWGH